jgi:hypothetical protein
MNSYQIYARFFPTVISAIPALLFQYFFLNTEISNFFQFLIGLTIIGNLTISIAILYLFSQVNRILAKILFEKKEIFMPTTNSLFFSNPEYSNEYKNMIYDKIWKDFSMKLPSSEEQITNEINSRRRISEAISLVRKKVGSGTLLLQHNTEYGFWRNLIGGAIISGLFSLIDIYFAFLQSDIAILVISILFLLGNLILIIFNKFIINKLGELYARVLIQEYMVGN